MEKEFSFLAFEKLIEQREKERQYTVLLRQQENERKSVLYTQKQIEAELKRNNKAYQDMIAEYNKQYSEMQSKMEKGNAKYNDVFGFLIFGVTSELVRTIRDGVRLNRVHGAIENLENEKKESIRELNQKSIDVIKDIHEIRADYISAQKELARTRKELADLQEKKGFFNSTQREMIKELENKVRVCERRATALERTLLEKSVRSLSLDKKDFAIRNQFLRGKEEQHRLEKELEILEIKKLDRKGNAHFREKAKELEERIEQLKRDDARLENMLKERGFRPVSEIDKRINEVQNLQTRAQEYLNGFDKGRIRNESREEQTKHLIDAMDKIRRGDMVIKKENSRLNEKEVLLNNIESARSDLAKLRMDRDNPKNVNRRDEFGHLVSEKEKELDRMLAKMEEMTGKKREGRDVEAGDFISSVKKETEQERVALEEQKLNAKEIKQEFNESANTHLSSFSGKERSMVENYILNAYSEQTLMLARNELSLIEKKIAEINAERESRFSELVAKEKEIRHELSKMPEPENKISEKELARLQGESKRLEKEIRYMSSMSEKFQGMKEHEDVIEVRFSDKVSENEKNNVLNKGFEGKAVWKKDHYEVQNTENNKQRLQEIQSYSDTVPERQNELGKIQQTLKQNEMNVARMEKLTELNEVLQEQTTITGMYIGGVNYDNEGFAQKMENGLAFQYHMAIKEKEKLQDVSDLQKQYENELKTLREINEKIPLHDVSNENLLEVQNQIEEMVANHNKNNDEIARASDYHLVEENEQLFLIGSYKKYENENTQQQELDRKRQERDNGEQKLQDDLHQRKQEKEEERDIENKNRKNGDRENNPNSNKFKGYEGKSNDENRTNESHSEGRTQESRDGGGGRDRG